jgi:hypothetical protein
MQRHCAVVERVSPSTTTDELREHLARNDQYIKQGIHGYESYEEVYEKKRPSRTRRMEFAWCAWNCVIRGTMSSVAPLVRAVTCIVPYVPESSP